MEDEEAVDEDAEEGEEEIEEEVEEEPIERKFGLADMLGEKMRQKVQANISVQDSDMRIYSAAQLSTEIEVIKGQERGLMTLME